MAEHVSVMVEEVAAWLLPERGGRFLDGTVGLGGHALSLLQRGGDVSLLGLDRDPHALEVARERLEGYGSRVDLAHSSFEQFPKVLKEVGWDGFEGALLDLGISSMQLDSPDRGFSFLQDGPLDMRMDKGGGAAPAGSLINKAPYSRLKYVIKVYGEEPLAGRIAAAIIREREKEPIQTTLGLAAIVEKAYPAARRAASRNHPATKTFQALRIAVNKELEALKIFLEEVFDYLQPGGRLAVISFHSLEDRLVKRAFKAEASGCVCPTGPALCTCGRIPRVDILTRKPVLPSEEEKRRNPRSRSAKLRVAQRRAAPERGTHEEK
ncbi:MAG: 16S rRNA (cytosine(1402)-N(4))-methyltransferase RsmH [Desulfovibrionales bacterium]